MRVNESKTKHLRYSRASLSVLSVALHPLLMPFYVSCVLSAAFFPFSFFTHTNIVILLMYLVCTFILPLVAGAIVLRTQHSKTLWRLEETTSRQLLTVLYAIFYATAYLFNRHVFFLPYMYGSLIICTLIMIASLLAEKRVRMDNHIAGLAFAATYIYCYCVRFGLRLLHVVALALFFAGLFIYVAIECRSTTAKSVMLSAVTAVMVTALTFLIL